LTMTSTRTTSFALTFVAAALAFSAAPASAQDDKVYTLRIQSHYSPEQTSGKLAQEFVDDVELMSQGQIDIEMFWSSSVVKTVEAFDAAATGIIDGEMVGASNQTGKDTAFQFVGDVMGGYDTPYQAHAWGRLAGGFDMANELYNEYDMELVGWWIYGQESLSSGAPIAGPADLENWKFRSPPGMETMIFENAGAKPIVMDFTEVFSALETKIIDGADYSGLANNRSIGLYDLVKHATYPGFHSMPMDHLAINKNKWDELPEHLQRIMHVAMEKLALRTAITFEVENARAAAELPEEGVTIHTWSDEDRKAFRANAQEAWVEFAAGSEKAEAMVASHKEFMQTLGIID